MYAICEPKRIISAAILSRLEISRTALVKHVRRRLVVPDFVSDAASFRSGPFAGTEKSDSTLQQGQEPENGFSSLPGIGQIQF
jgi:hypothetical protein